MGTASRSADLVAMATQALSGNEKRSCGPFHE